MRDTFTKEDAIKIQAQQIAKWRTVLQPAVADALEAYATSTNDSVRNPYDIRRGTTLDGWVANTASALRKVLDREAEYTFDIMK